MNVKPSYAWMEKYFILPSAIRRIRCFLCSVVVRLYVVYCTSVCIVSSFIFLYNFFLFAKHYNPFDTKYSMAESFCCCCFCFFFHARLRTIHRVAHNCEYFNSVRFIFTPPSHRFFSFHRILSLCSTTIIKYPSIPNHSNARFNGLRMFDIFNTTYAALNSIESKMDRKLNETVK